MGNLVCQLESLDKISIGPINWKALINLESSNYVSIFEHNL